MHINQLLQTAVASGASDLHLKVGSYPMMRVNGSLVVASEEVRLDRTQTEAMATGGVTPRPPGEGRQPRGGGRRCPRPCTWRSSARRRKWRSPTASPAWAGSA